MIITFLLTLAFTLDATLDERLGFEDLRVTDVIIGIEPHERIQPQDLLIDLSTALDKEIGSSVDAGKLVGLTQKLAQEGEYLFIDLLGRDILKSIFETYPEVIQASIQIQKPAALPSARSGGLIEIALTREENAEQKILGNIGFNALQVPTGKEDLKVDLRVAIDLQAVAASNQLDATVNYVLLADIFKTIALQNDKEVLAAIYLNKIFEQFPQIEMAHLRIWTKGCEFTETYKER